MTQVSQLDSESWFFREQEVQQITWWIPEEVYDKLVEQSIAEAGTRRHMGKLATEAMVANIQDDSENLRHKTWYRMKNDYDYGQSPYDPQYWDYRVDRNYDDVANEDKTQLSISVPVDVVREFTEHLQDKDYGNWLAEIISDEINKRRQIDRMHTIIDRMNGQVDDSDGRGNSEVSNITMQDTDVVEESIDSSQVSGPDNRRGVIASRLRSRERASKETVYDLSEVYGITSRPTKRKDFEEIARFARVGDCPIEIHPTKQILDSIDSEYNLAQAAEIKKNNLVIQLYESRSGDEEKYEWIRDVFECAFYSNLNSTANEQWREVLYVIEDYVSILCSVPWKPAGKMSGSVTIDHVKAKKDSLEAIRDIVQIASDITQETNEMVNSDLIDVFTKISEELSDCPDNFDSDWDEVQKKRHDTHTKQKDSDRKTTLTW